MSDKINFYEKYSAAQRFSRFLAIGVVRIGLCPPSYVFRPSQV